MTYSDSTPWPVPPDGNGPTFMLKSCQLDNSNPDNWISSNTYGTPGKANELMIVSVKDAGLKPGQITLNQNHPNPFNPSTKITYELARSDYVRLSIFNVLGYRIATLVDEFQQGGSYKVI